LGNGWFDYGLGGIKGMGYNSYFWWKGQAWGRKWWNGGGKGGGGGKVGRCRTWGGAGYVKPISGNRKGGGGANDIELPDDGKGTDIENGRS